MNFLPVLERELRARARKRASYWSRSSLALVGLITCLPLIAGGHAFGQPQLSGRYAFHFLVSLAFLLCCLASLLTSDAVRTEHREGTLGLLFLTQVRALDVVTAKLGSVGLTCLSGLLALVPVLILPVLAGGVGGGEAFRTGLALICTLLLALTAGFWHVEPVRSGSPLLRPALLMLGLVLLPFLLWQFGAGPTRYAGSISPLVAAITAAESNYRAQPWEFWSCIFGLMVLGCILLILGSRRLQNLVRYSGSGGEASTAATRKKLRWESGKEGRNPVQWLFLRLPGVRALFWCGALVSVFQQLTYSLFYRFVAGPRGLFGMALTVQLPSLVISAIAGVFFAYGVCRFWTELRRNGELELLLTSGVTPGDVLAGQWGALQKLLWGPVLVMGLPVVLQLVSMFQYRFYSAAQFWWLDYAVSMGLSLLNVALNVVALCWLGLWFGYRARSTPAALAWTLGIAKLLPFVISAIAYPIVTRGLNRLLGGSSPRSFSWLIHLVFTVLFLYLVCFARRRLRRALGDRKDFGVQDLVLAGRELWWKARRWRPG